MADGTRIQSNGEATACLRGVTLAQKPVVFLVLKRREFCAVTIDTGAVKVPVSFFDKLAEEIAGVARGSTVRVTGKLIQHEWETGDRQKRACLEVEAETLEVLSGPTEAP